MTLRSFMHRWRSRSIERQREYERNLSMIESLSGVPQRPKKRFYDDEERKRY